MAKWIAAEKVRAGLQQAVVCPNVTGRTKEKIAQSKWARAGSLALVNSHKWRELVFSGRVVYSCHVLRHSNDSFILWYAGGVEASTVL